MRRTSRIASVRHSSPAWSSLIAGLALLAACGPADDARDLDLMTGAGAVDDARLADADADEENWLTYGRTYKEQRHSPLTQISEETVDRLGLAWSHDFGHMRGLEGTPLVVDGVLYATSAWSILHAFNAATGELMWTHDPEVPRGHARFVCCDVVNRGPAFYRGKVYNGTLDGRLVAVAAETGEQVWETRTTPEDEAYAVTGAPRIAGGKVLIGNGGAEFGVRGYVSAYDAETGELDWRVYTVPGNPADGFESAALEAAAETWSGEWWTAGGGGTAWDAIVYDPELDLVYIGVGNGSPWYERLRSPGGGDNLYLSSILAVRGSDGEYVWHYQTTPGDNWDYTATQPLMLAELEIEGRERRVIMQAPKNGFFYVLDRETGEFLSAEMFSEINWATGIDESGRPIENPAARALEGGVHVAPGPEGSHNWHPMSFNPETGLVYFPVYENSMLHAVDETWEYDKRRWNIGADFDYDGPTTGEELPVKGFLTAWDPVAQTEVWRADQPDPISGGTLSTAGNLVFQGRADGLLRAYRATDGEALWEFQHETGMAAAPITYSVDGTQYVAILAGWGGPEVLINSPLGVGSVGPARILAFALDGAAELPEPAPPLPPIEAPAMQIELSEAEMERAGDLYDEYCWACHGFNVESISGVPDLRRASAATHETFEDIVLGGMRESLGMPRWDDVLTPDDVRLIQGLVLTRARESAAGN